MPQRGPCGRPCGAIFTVCQGRLSGGLVTRHGCWDLTGVEAAGARREAERLAAEGRGRPGGDTFASNALNAGRYFPVRRIPRSFSLLFL